MKVVKIKRADVPTLFGLLKGNVFSATFQKRDGSIRHMVCRKGVTSHLKGGDLKFDPRARGLEVVFDFQKGEYRMVNVNTLSRIRAFNTEFEVE